MSRFYFHLIDGEDTLLDPEGLEMRFDQVPGKAVSQARSIIAHDALAGVIDFKYSLEVRDEADKVVHSMPFDVAVQIKNAA